MSATAEVIIKGRNDLSRAVREAERDLKQLNKTGELVGKIFRGGAIVGAVMAFERLTENAQRAAEAIGDKGTAGALKKLNRELDSFKTKASAGFGRIIADIYTGIAGSEGEQLEVKVRNLTATLRGLREEYERQGGGGFRGGQLRSAIFATEAQISDFRERQAYLLKFNSGSGRAPGSQGGAGSRDATFIPGQRPPKASAADPMAGLSELTVWQRELFDFQTMSSQWADDFNAEFTNRIVQDVNLIANETRAMTTVIEQAEQPLSQMTVFAEEAARNMQGIFANWFMEMDGGFKGLLGSFADMLRQMVAQLLAQEILTQFFSWGSGFDGWFGSFSKSALPGRAGGGPVTGGRPYMVGERGPELFVPGASGTIIPNGAGGGAVVVNNYITINDETDLKRSLPAILAETTRQSVAATKAEIRGDMKRYGKIR